MIFLSECISSWQHFLNISVQVIWKIFTEWNTIFQTFQEVKNDSVNILYINFKKIPLTASMKKTTKDVFNS